MKVFYISAWVLLAAAASATVLTGSFNAVALLVFSLAALVLVYGLALWSVTADARDLKTE